MKKRVLTILFILPVTSLASPLIRPVWLVGECTIKNSHSNQVFRVTSSRSEKLILGYIGEDQGRYKISIANNGGNSFESSNGAIVIGFSRDIAPFQNPPELCPTYPEDLKKQCEERNAKNNPPFKPTPTDYFHRKLNLDGDVDAEVGPKTSGGTIDPDDFILYKVAIPAKNIPDDKPVSIQTPIATLGGVRTSCSLDARRN